MAQKKSGKAEPQTEPTTPTTSLKAETPRLALFRIGAIGGVFTGLAMFIYFLVIRHFTAINPLTPVRELDNGLFIFGLVFTFWYIKNARPMGQFQFWEGLFVGFVLSFVAGQVAAVLTWFYLEQVDTTIIPEYIQWSLTYLEKIKAQTLEHFNEAGYKAEIAGLQRMKAADIWKDIAIRKVITGIILVPIVAAFMRKSILIKHDSV